MNLQRQRSHRGLFVGLHHLREGHRRPKYIVDLQGLLPAIGATVLLYVVRQAQVGRQAVQWCVVLPGHMAGKAARLFVGLPGR